MTKEGIVQQWFNHVEDGNGYIPEWLKQELIEEIKQALSEYYERGALQKLIGDTK